MNDFYSEPPKSAAHRDAPLRESAMSKALRLLNRSWYSEATLTDKLYRAGYHKGEVEEAIAQCRRYGFLNDERLAEDYATSLAAQGRGKLRIQRDLHSHGLRGETASAALENLPDSEEERATEVLRRRLPALLREPDRRKRREKAFRFLAGRGFAPSAIFQALETLRGELFPADSEGDFEAEENWENS